MDKQINIRWVCLDCNCNFGRVVDTVSEILLHSQQNHKLIKLDKFREMIRTLFDDSYISCLLNEQHYIAINHCIQNLISFLKQSLSNFECTYKQKLDEFYEQIHPRKKIIEISQAIIKKNEIDKEILNEYLDNYVQKFQISQNTQQKLDKLQNQILNFCQSQRQDWEAKFEKQLILRRVPNICQQPQQQIDCFDSNKSSPQIQFTNDFKTARALDQKCFLYYPGQEKAGNMLMEVEMNILNLDDHIFNIGVVSQNNNPSNYQGCYLLTNMGTVIRDQESLQTNITINNGSIIRVRYSKKHPKQIFFSIDNSLKVCFISINQGKNKDEKSWYLSQIHHNYQKCLDSINFQAKKLLLKTADFIYLQSKELNNFIYHFKFLGIYHQKKWIDDTEVYQNEKNNILSRVLNQLNQIYIFILYDLNHLLM